MTPTRRFRTRLTTVFVLAASTSSGFLAVGSYAAATRYRQGTFAQRAEDQARLGLLSVAPDLSRDRFEALLAEYRQRAGFESIAVVGGAVFSSDPGIGLESVPGELRDRSPLPGSTERQATSVRGKPYLVVRGTPMSGDGAVYFFFSKVELQDSLRAFREVLAVGWLVATAAAALLGSQVARRTLRPVAAAATAAREIAGGRLVTRLPEGDDEFGQWARAFNDMAVALGHKVAELSEAAERERRFTANVAHDLRTPLAGMTSAAELLAEELPGLGQPARRLAEMLIDDVGRLEALVVELLELSRHDAGQEAAELEELSVVDAVQAVLGALALDGVKVTAGADGVGAWADRARLGRVLSNLLTNAVHHGGGDVEVRVGTDRDTAVIEVLDRGPGLGPGEDERVFERFYKADSARSSGGSGLGLAIAAENARLQGGSLKAANRPGGGAAFTLSLRAAGRPGLNGGRPGGPDRPRR